MERSAAGCSVRGAAPSLTLRYEPVETVTWFDRLLAVAGLLAVAAGGAWSLRRGWLSEWFRRWPALFGVVFGLAWWLWLSPSLLGWGMVLASLAVSVLSAWRRSTPPPGSSVIALRSLMRWERDDS